MGYVKDDPLKKTLYSTWALINAMNMEQLLAHIGHSKVLKHLPKDASLSYVRDLAMRETERKHRLDEK